MIIEIVLILIAFSSHELTKGTLSYAIMSSVHQEDCSYIISNDVQRSKFIFSMEQDAPFVSIYFIEMSGDNVQNK